MKYSSGMKKDFLIIGTASAILTIAQTDETAKKDKQLTHLSNKTYKINRKIRDKIADLRQKLHTTQD